jgi:hypothetical protein
VKLRDFELQECNHFVAMEYYGLILNRTYLILITRDYLLGLKVNGLVSVEVGRGSDPLTRAITNSMAIMEDKQNPYAYMKEKFLRKMENLDIFGEAILKVSNANFKIERTKIADVYYNEKKKWGMGQYPHDGRVILKIADGKKREFIILGMQSGEKIKSYIKTLPNST